MKKIKLFLLGFSLVFLTGCNLFGLELQENYDFDDSLYDPHTNMSVMEYMRSLPEQYSSMVEAIEYAEMENSFSNSDYTFLVLTNDACTSYFKANKLKNPDYKPGVDNPVKEYFIPSSWKDYKKETVQEFLKYHILLGYYNWGNLNSTSKDWIKTSSYVENSPADTCLVLMEVLYQEATLGGCHIYLNNWEGVEPDVEGTMPIKSKVEPVHSSIFCTDGLIHVLDTYLKAPKKVVIDFYNYEIK